MLTIRQATEQALSQIPDPGECPAPVYLWHAYKQGKLVGTALTQAQCWNFYNTHVTERVCINQDAIDHWLKQKRDHQQLVTGIWYNALREEYSDLSPELFALCYDKAYDQGHSSGYDEVAAYMQDTVEFAKQVQRLSKL
jgi:hypothetical protein